MPLVDLKRLWVGMDLWMKLNALSRRGDVGGAGLILILGGNI
jgi:hypothetical protein